MAERKLKKVAQTAKTVGSTKMGPDGEFLIKDQDFRTKGGQTVEPNKGLAEKARQTLDKAKKVEEIKKTRPYYDFDLKGKGQTIEPNKNVGKLAVDAKAPDRPVVKPETAKEFELKGKGRTIEPNKQLPKELKPQKMPNMEVSNKPLKNTAKPNDVDLAQIKPKKTTKLGPVKKALANHDTFVKGLEQKSGLKNKVRTLAAKAAGSVGKFLLGEAGKAIATKVASKVVGPVSLVSDAASIAEAGVEGYKAYKAGKEYRTLYEKMKNKKYKPAISPDGKPTGL